jgi:hypothetical protein
MSAGGSVFVAAEGFDWSRCPVAQRTSGSEVMTRSVNPASAARGNPRFSTHRAACRLAHPTQFAALPARTPGITDWLGHTAAFHAPPWGGGTTMGTTTSSVALSISLA